jgi:hypothetical protein
MASSTNKRVLVVRFDREPVTGVVNPAVLFQDGFLEVLSLGGNLITIPATEAKAVCFVKDLPTTEVWKPNRFFTVRPKMEGLWLRLRFRDEDAMDGVAPNNLLLLEPNGFQVIPPDTQVGASRNAGPWCHWQSATARRCFRHGRPEAPGCCGSDRTLR